MSYNSTHTGAQIDAAIDAVENKQDKLVSGTNIKTINGQSVMGSGNLSIEATGTYECTYDVTTYADVVAAIQAGKTPIVKIGDKYNDNIYTLSEWNKGSEVLRFSAISMTINEGSTFVDPDSNFFVTGVLLKNYPDDSTTDSGWSYNPYQWVPKDVYTTEEVDSRLSAKQNILTSGTNIKTINGESMLGGGNLVIGGSDPTPISEARIKEICVPRQLDGYSIEFPASISATSNFEVGYTNGTTEPHPANWYAGKTINSVEYFKMTSLEATFDTNYTFLTNYDKDKGAATSQTVSRIMTEKYVFLTSNIRITNIIND